MRCAGGLKGYWTEDFDEIFKKLRVKGCSCVCVCVCFALRGFFCACVIYLFLHGRFRSQLFKL